MTPEEILQGIADQSDGAVSKATLIHFLNNEVKNGAQILQQDNTLISFKSTQKTTVFFYLFSLDEIEQVDKAVGMMFDLFRQFQYEIAETHYEAPFMNRIYMKYGAEITTDPEGGYRAKVRL